MKRIALALAVLAACGDDDGPSPTVTIHAARTKLLAIDEGADGSWRELEAGTDGDVTIKKGPFLIASICDGVEGFRFVTHAATTDVPELRFYCADATPPVAVTLEDTSFAGTRAFVGTNTVQQGNPTMIQPGTYDVVAVDDTVQPPRFEIRRDVAITADTELSFALMTAPEMAPVMISSPETMFQRYSTLVTKNQTYAQVLGQIAQGPAYAFPASALVDGDKHSIEIATTRANNELLGAAHVVTGGETSVSAKFPAGYRAAAATYADNVLEITYDIDGTWSRRSASGSNADDSSLWQMFVYKEFADATTVEDGHVVTPMDPTKIPGWDAAWSAFTPTNWFVQVEAVVGPDSQRAARSGMFQ